MRTIIIFCCLLIAVSSADAQRKFGDKPKKPNPEKEASDVTSILIKELGLTNAQANSVYDIYVEYYKNLDDMMRKNKDMDQNESATAMDKATDKLRDELTAVLTTNQMDKWEKFQENSRQFIRKGPPR